MLRRVGFVLAGMLAAVPAAAQTRVDIGGAVSALNLENRTSWSLAAAIGFRFTRIVGLEVEATFVPSLKTDLPVATIQTLSPYDAALAADLTALGLAPTVFPGPRVQNVDGRMLVLSNNVRVAIPTTNSAVEPYFVAGGGVASTRRTGDITYPIYIVNPVANVVVGTPPPLIPIQTVSRRLTSNALDLSLTLGGGVGIRVSPRLMVDADLRLLRLTGADDRNVGRFGAGLRYRF